MRAATDAAIAAAREALGPDRHPRQQRGREPRRRRSTRTASTTSWATTLAVNLTAYTRTIRAALEDLRRDGAGASSTWPPPRGSAPPPASRRTPRRSTAWSGSPGRWPWSSGRPASPSTASAPDRSAPGMTELIPEEAKVKFARRRVPMRRYGDPEEVAQITLSLRAPGGVVHHRRGDPRRRRPHRAEHMTVRDRVPRRAG